MTSYGDWVREGEAELARMGDPTEEEKREMLLEVDRENAEQAEQEEGFVRTNVTPIDLVFGEFVEYHPGKWVRAEKVRSVNTNRHASPGDWVSELDMAPGEDFGTSFSSKYPTLVLVNALNLALENGRQRRVERSDY